MGIPGAGPLGGWIGRQALRKGLLGTSRLWLAVFVAGRVVWLMRRMSAKRPAPVVYSERLAAGSAIEIRHRRPRRR